MIESLTNERVKYWCKLKTSKYQKREKLFLVEGEHLVEEAAKRGLLIEIIAREEGKFSFPQKTLVSEDVMKKITALDNPPRIIGVARLLESSKIVGRVLILEAIQDPGNLGTIIRSAAAFGIDTIIMSEDTVSIYNSKVLRASEGLIFKINIVSARELRPTIEELKRRGYVVYTTDVKGGTDLRECEFSRDTAIIMGNEGRGVSPEIASLADKRLYIPMNSDCESLNVGVATSIILYEQSRHI